MSEQRWVDAAGADELIDDDVVGVQAEGREFALYSVGGEVYATDNLCTHGQARLCDGFLEGHEIECPLHQGRFDIRDGRALCAPLDADVRSYPVRMDEGRIWLRID